MEAVKRRSRWRPDNDEEREDARVKAGRERERGGQRHLKRGRADSRRWPGRCERSHCQSVSFVTVATELCRYSCNTSSPASKNTASLLAGTSLPWAASSRGRPFYRLYLHHQ